MRSNWRIFSVALAVGALAGWAVVWVSDMLDLIERVENERS